MNVYQVAIIEGNNPVMFSGKLFDCYDKAVNLLKEYDRDYANHEVLPLYKLYDGTRPDLFPQNEFDFEYVFFIVEIPVL